MELRKPYFDPTTFAYMSIDTIQNRTKEVRVQGLAAINFFLNRKTGKQPVHSSDNNVILMNGNYQIPIYADEPF